MQIHFQERRYMMGLVMCLMLMAPGMWVPSLPNILRAHDALWALSYATMLGPLGGALSALVFGALSDRRMNSEKLLGLLGLSGAVFLWLGFSSLKWGWHPGWYLVFQGVNALISGPMFALIAKVKLANLPNVQRHFPIYSMAGTLGWMGGGWIVSALSLDQSADAGCLAAGVRFGMSWLCFLMPATPPKDHASRGWKAVLGLTAFKLLKDRELRVFYIASALLMVPIMSFFMITPLMLKDLGSQYPTAQMTLGQVAELGALLFLSAAAGRFRVRWFLLVGMLLALLRFILLAVAGSSGALVVAWLGIALHGPIYSFMMVAGRMFLDKRVPETMRGQAQALYQLLVGCFAGIVGAFLCGWLYEMQVDGTQTNWTLYWTLLALMTTVPLAYFAVGVIKQPNAIKRGQTQNLKI
ncbi:MAG: MFS transporter [Coraliomargarita sp.]